MKIHSGALNIMRFHAANGSKARWAAYQNMPLDSPKGRLVYLSVSPDGIYPELPKQHPANKEHGKNYRFVGWVDLETGKVKEVK